MLFFLLFRNYQKLHTTPLIMSIIGNVNACYVQKCRLVSQKTAETQKQQFPWLTVKGQGKETCTCFSICQKCKVNFGGLLTFRDTHRLEGQ